MKTLPFDLEKALAGAKVVNGRGDVVTGLRRVDTPGHLGDRLVGAAGERVQIWRLEGVSPSGPECDLLLVAPEPIVRWVNFYGPPTWRRRAADYFDTEPEADAHALQICPNSARGVVESLRLYGRAIRVEIEPEVQP